MRRRRRHDEPSVTQAEDGVRDPPGEGVVAYSSAGAAPRRINSTGIGTARSRRVSKSRRLADGSDGGGAERPREGEEDGTWFRVEMDGRKDGKGVRYTYDMLDRYDRPTQTTSMPSSGRMASPASTIFSIGTFSRFRAAMTPSRESGANPRRKSSIVASESPRPRR